MTQEDKWIGSWYDQADRLQAIENSHGLDDNDLMFNMRTIIYLGEESSGKSSTMERLASLKLFPTDRKLCTRLLVKLCIRYCPEEQLAIGDSETHSGVDTRKGKFLRLELKFKNDPVIDLKRADESTVATLRRGYSYNEVKAYAFLRFTRMVNISGVGIGVSE